METGTGSTSEGMIMGLEEANNKGFLSLPTTMSTIFNPQSRKTINYYGHRASEGCSSANNDESIMRSKIMAHPLYPRLLAAYVNCQKVGAPPEVVAKLDEACFSNEAAMGNSSTSCVGEDPALDQFMEAYCEMLSKYEQELTKPLKEAMVFLSRVECQIKTLAQDSGNVTNDYGIYGKNVDASGSNHIDPQADEVDLKGQLLRRYSGYFGSLKQDFLKKKKKGKLPKEARQKLLDWWNKHYKWPYPSESQKLALAQSTGLDQKQINNWFINQRKRHWNPSESMQFGEMDTVHPHIYMENLMNNAYPMVDYGPMYSFDIKFSSANQCL